MQDEVDELMRRLDVAEKLAAEKHNDYSNLCYRAEVGRVQQTAAKTCQVGLQQTQHARYLWFVTCELGIWSGLGVAGVELSLDGQGCS